MAGREEIRLIGRVVEILSGTACRVELVNGHELIAHTTRKQKMDLTRLKPGDELKLAASPFDLSKARVADEQQTEQRL